ncbi:MAG TPA: thioesterase family protein [Polyangiaceae bacterium]|nr:thioesterase family protein [Polyangiaceae bacterium]
MAPSDIDELGHANNVVWLRWVNEAARAHSDAVGFGPAGLRRLGVLWVVRRHEIDYLAPAHEAEELEAITWAHTLSAASSLRRTLFKRAGSVLARAETTWVLIDPGSGKPRRVPREILAAYGFGEDG